MSSKIKDNKIYDIKYIFDLLEKKNLSALPKLNGCKRSERRKRTYRRLWVFKEKGVDCVHCGAKGSFFKFIFGTPQLFAVNSNNENVIMTIDHIIPLSKNGKDRKDNTQPMCEICNNKKADKILPEKLV